MKILVFEYLCGGGLGTEFWDDTLVAEGKLMLSALLDELRQLPEHKVEVILDRRQSKLAEHYPIVYHWVEADCHFETVFQTCLQQAEAVWLIAPESQSLLEKLAIQVIQAGKILLGCSPEAIQDTADKWTTFLKLQYAQIATIPTQLATETSQFPQFPCIIKARDGVGCQDIWFARTKTEFNNILANLDSLDNFIVQPLLNGRHLSISALFFEGAGKALCLNEQRLRFIESSLKLEGLNVNCDVLEDQHHRLCSQIASAIPGLFGYVGIDLLEVDKHLLITEINPRLTSSYAAMSKALGINCAELILRRDGSMLEVNCKATKSIELSLN